MSDFWSRRRAAAAAEREAEGRARAEVSVAERHADLEAMPEAEALEALGLPAPETLDKGDDFAAFLRAEVPAWLRRRALRRLWRVNPALANLDGMIDYGEDYTDAARVVPNLATAYQVGRGMARHVAALAEAAEEPKGKRDGGEDDATVEAAHGSSTGEPADGGRAAARDPGLPVDNPATGGDGMAPERARGLPTGNLGDDAGAADALPEERMPAPCARRMTFVYDSETYGEGRRA